MRYLLASYAWFGNGDKLGFGNIDCTVEGKVTSTTIREMEAKIGKDLLLRGNTVSRVIILSIVFLEGK